MGLLKVWFPLTVWQWLAPASRLALRPKPRFVVSRWGPGQKHSVHAVGSIHRASH